MTGGSLVECREFIIAGFQLAGGYSAAMGLGPATSAGWTVVIGTGCIVLLLPIWLSLRLHPADRRQCALTMLFFWGLLFITWKSCFVRYHAGRIPVFLGSVLPLLVYGFIARAETAVVTNSRSHWQSQWHTFTRVVGAVCRRLTGPAMLVSVVCVISAGTIELVRPLSVSSVLTGLIEPPQDQLLAIAASAKDPDWRQRLHEIQLAEIREANPIPEIDGTVDVFPSKLIVAFAHGLQLQPRPVLQSYAAFTPALIERDSRHFSGPTAPDNVLLSIGQIDGRLPTMEDSRAWLELLTSYDLTDSSCDWLRLSRREHRGVALAPEPVLRKTVTWGEAVNPPEELHGPVWCRLSINPSLTGRLASVAYRMPEIRLQVRDEENSVRLFRLIPGAAESGFLISPLIETRDDLIELWQTTDASRTNDARVEQPVASIVCDVSGDPWGRAMFDSTIAVEFFEISTGANSPSPAKTLREVAFENQGRGKN